MKRIDSNEELHRINSNCLKNVNEIKNVKKNNDIVDIVDISGGNKGTIVTKGYSNIILNEFNTQKTKDLAEIFQAIDNGYKGMVVSDKEVVVVIGNTGSGKSTLVNYLTNKELVVQKPINIKKEGALVIDSKDKSCEIGHMNQSKTTIPNRDATTSTIYWDCSGFRDTRKFKADVINQVYINNIFKNTEKIKVLVLIDQPNLDASRGGAFDEILSTLNSMFKNSKEVLNDSCIFVFTKMKGYNLDGLKQDLKNNYANEKSDLDDSSKEILSNIIKNDRITMFSYPEQVGEINQEENKFILSLLEKTQFTSNPQVEVSLSPGNIGQLMGVKKQIDSEIHTIVTEVAKWFKESISKLSDEDLDKLGKDFALLGEEFKNFQSSKDILDFFDKKIFVYCKNDKISKGVEKIRYFAETVYKNFFSKLIPNADVRFDKFFAVLLDTGFYVTNESVIRKKDLDAIPKINEAQKQYSQQMNEVRPLLRQQEVDMQNILEDIQDANLDQERVNARVIREDSSWNTGTKVGAHIGVTVAGGVIGVIGGTMITTTTIVTAGSAAALAGAEIGSTIGVVGGPVGMAIGAGIGVAVGGLVGTLFWVFK